MKTKLLVLMAVLTPGSHVRAESASLPCIQFDRVLPSSSDLPANAPAFVFVPGVASGRAFETDVAAGWVPQLKDPTGAAVPVTGEPEADAILLRPDIPLAPGAYSVSYPDVCGSFHASNQTRTVSLNVGPYVALPTTVGTLGTPTFQAYADCYPQVGSLNVPVVLSPEMFAYREVATVTAAFDGDTSVFGYGNGPQSGNVLTVSFRRTCTRGQAHIRGRVTIAAHIAGVALGEDPVPISQEIAVLCPFAGEPPPDKDPGMCAPEPVIDAGVRDASLDAEIGPPDADLSHRQGGSGCSMSAGYGTNATGSAMILLTLASLVGMLRRRR